MYGLKQASRRWFEKLTTLLLQHGYQQVQSDSTLFTKKSGSDFTAFLIYVDDILLAGSFLAEFTLVMKLHDKAFRIKDLGTLKIFLFVKGNFVWIYSMIQVSWDPNLLLHHWTVPYGYNMGINLLILRPKGAL